MKQASIYFPLIFTNSFLKVITLQRVKTIIDENNLINLSGYIKWSREEIFKKLKYLVDLKKI